MTAGVLAASVANQENTGVLFSSAAMYQDLGSYPSEKSLTLSFWIKGGNSTGTKYIFRTEGFSFDIRYDSGFLNILAQNSSTTNILQLRHDVKTQDSLWKHIMVSFDLTDTAKRHFYVNGSAASSSWLAYTNDTIALDGNAIFAGQSVSGSTVLNKHPNLRLYDFWLDFGRYTDFSDSANRLKFYDGGDSINLGPDGSAPFGAAPDIFMGAKNISSWPINKGSLSGTFNVDGTLIAEAGPYA